MDYVLLMGIWAENLLYCWKNLQALLIKINFRIVESNYIQNNNPLIRVFTVLVRQYLISFTTVLNTFIVFTHIKI